MAKLRITIAEKREVAGSPLTYDILMRVDNVTSDAGAVIGSIAGGPTFLVRGLTSAQAATLTTGTVYNCPIQT